MKSESKAENYIDLRSDTVTRPSEGMRKAMYEAEVGDDVLGDDPTVKRLEEMICMMLGTEDALFVPSGTQANLLGIMSHCDRGDEYIAGQGAHCYNHEGGGAAVLASVQPQPIEFQPDGTLSLEEIEAKIKPDDFHFARTRLLCLENTTDGKTVPVEYIRKAHELCRRRGLSMHLDGARLFNAAIASGVAAKDMAGFFNTVSVCLSKGLGAPVGSLICGRIGNIEKARRWRKVLGGGMRQAGVIAAAGIYALQNNIERLAVDHENAASLASGLSGIDGVSITHQSTNMLFIGIEKGDPAELSEFLRQKGILTLPGRTMRLVTHLDISSGDVANTVRSFREYFKDRK